VGLQQQGGAASSRDGDGDVSRQRRKGLDPVAMGNRPRHALAATAILTAVTLGSWTALSTDSPKPAPPAAASEAAPPVTLTTKPRVLHVTKPDRPENPPPRPCLDGPARPPRSPGHLTGIAGDFDGDHARDQLLAYAELDAAGLPRQWRVRVVLATGHVADLALDNISGWIGPQRAGRPPGG
jgi:hypothetical protein